MQKSATCPECHRTNVFEAPSPDETFESELPGNLLKTGAVIAVSLLNPLIGIAAGGALLAQGAVAYRNGTAVTCSNCGHTFRVRS